MIAQAELVDEVREVIESRLRPGVRLSAKWLAHEIITEHQDISGADCEWYQRCAYHHVRSTVGEVLRGYRLRPEDDSQLKLEGFEHLQKAYLIEGVNGDEGEQLVGIDECSLAELREKISELRAMAAGCLAHAHELERYCNQKFPAYGD